MDREASGGGPIIDPLGQVSGWVGESGRELALDASTHSVQQEET